MVQLVLEGDTLGDRQKHYNALLKKILSGEKSTQLEKINIMDDDVQNMIRIDLANCNRNVEYILEVLKSEDMLYVSRAIKRCAWLITDPQYAHIVNPDYLHTQLFPQMTAKASSKLMLQIRLNLKDEERVEGFYKHLRNRNKKAALRWLPHCSLAFIEKKIESYIGYIELPLIKRLCERSISVLEIHIRKCEHYKRDILKTTMFLMNMHALKYFDILDTVDPHQLPKFGPKFTRLAMKKCPQRILDNFAKFCDKIDLETFTRHLKSNNIKKDFLLKYVDTESMRYWFKFENLRHFVKHMPKNGRFEFLKKVLIQKLNKDDIAWFKPDDLSYQSDDCQFTQTCAMSSKSSSSANVYRYYRFAAFNVAFPDIKKLIRIESSPVERNAMLGELVSCAGRNRQHMHSLLQYYHDKHINEPFKFKIQFVNNVLSTTDTHVFDDKTWSILNNIFCSMEVYTESENNVQYCIQAIIVYKILHYEKVPEIVEKKFTFDTLKSLQRKLNKEEKDKIFTYLYNILVTKIQNKKIRNEVDFVEVLQNLHGLLNLLIDWGKELSEFRWILCRIKMVIKIKMSNSWAVNLSPLYNKNKSWRIHMFEDSFYLSPCEETFINALKHDPELFDRHRSQVEALCRNDRVLLDRLLSKLRIYWPESLASEWTDWYLGELDSPGRHKAHVRGLCILLPQKDLIEVAKKYAPKETTIKWSEDDNNEFSLCKQFARYIYLARPLLSPEILWLYTQGDYLQFALSSLSAILHNLSPANSRAEVTKFLDAPVSLQKHAIRFAFSKLESKELKLIFYDVWKSTNNLSIRAVLFKQTYDLLCREKKSSMLVEIWELLNMFIDDLSQDEDKRICDVLGKVVSLDKVPLAIRAKFLMKGYKYLKSLPVKANYGSLVLNLINYTRNIMETLDPDFMNEILLETLDQKYETKRYAHTLILSSYLLCAKDTKSQTQRYEKILAPLLERSINQWKLKIDGCFFARNTVNDILKQLCNDLQIYVLELKMEVPVKMFTDILTKLEGKLSLQNNYALLRSWKLTVIYVKLLDGQKVKIKSITGRIGKVKSEPSVYYNDRGTDNTWNEVYLNVAPEFADSCMKLLKEDVKAYFSSIHVLFTNALRDMFLNIEINRLVILQTFKYMLGCKDFIEGYLVVLRALPEPRYNDVEQTEKLSGICKIIRSHTSPEVKIHYYEKYLNSDFDTEC